MTTNSKFKVLHANVRSLTKNLENLEHVINEINVLPEVVCITETKLKDNYQSKPNMTGYQLECINSTTNAGGVGVYIKSDISYKKNYKLSA